MDPNSPVECFGTEVSNRTKSLLTGQSVRLEADPSQDERDKYGRLLRYVFVGETNVGLALIQDGYAYEYTYDGAYKYQGAFKAAQVAAQSSKKGLWGEVCDSAGAAAETPADSGASSAASADVAGSGECVIKGNITSSGGEKIYHVPGCASYSATSVV